MVCRLGISTDPERRIEYWKKREGHTHSKILEMNLRAFQVDGFESSDLTYQGAFYGPEASAVGTISGTIAEESGAEYTKIGFFWGAPPTE